MEINMTELINCKHELDTRVDELMGNQSLSAINNVLIACYQLIDSLSPTVFSETGDTERHRMFGEIDGIR